MSCKIQLCDCVAFGSRHLIITNIIAELESQKFSNEKDNLKIVLCHQYIEIVERQTMSSTLNFPQLIRPSSRTQLSAVIIIIM